MEDDFFNRARSRPKIKSLSTSSIGQIKKRKSTDDVADELLEISAGISQSPDSPPLIPVGTKVPVTASVKPKTKRKLTPPPILSAAQKQAACETVLHSFRERMASESAIEMASDGKPSINLPSATRGETREVVEVLVEGTDDLNVDLEKPVLLIKMEASDEVFKVKNAYCSRNGIGPEAARALTLVWRKVRIFDFLTPKALGMPPKTAVKIMPIEKADGLGKVAQKGVDNNSPSKSSVDNTPVKKPSDGEQWKRILMRDGKKHELRLEVRLSHPVSNLLERWRNEFNIATGVKLKISYEGESMAPASSIADAGLDIDNEDPDGVDVIDVNYT